ncbi:MAG: hypothetical protein ACREK8_00850 [Gemmatimonadales bacterium]
MLESSFALVGIVLQWFTSLLLVLLFYRLGHAGTHRRLLWTWAAAWGGQLASITGFTVNAIAAMTGHASTGVPVFPSNEVWYVPGTLLFMVLLAVGAGLAVGRKPPVGTERIAVTLAIGSGLFAALLSSRVVTGALLVLVTSAVAVGSLIRIGASERRVRGRRLMLPAAILVLGAVMVTYQVIRYFGAALDPLGDFAAQVDSLAAYGGALMSALVAGGVIVMITEDDVRAREYAVQERSRAVARARKAVSESRALELAARSAASAVEPETVPAERVAVAAMAESPAMPSRVNAEPLPLRAPPVAFGTRTLPPPGRRADGSADLALVIDEDAAVRATLARVFQRGGWGVREAASGAEALGWLVGIDARQAPTVVLTPLNSPGIGGRELYSHLQSLRPDLLQRLVFVADDEDAATATEFIRAARCPWIRRPATVEEIARAVSQVLMQQ